MSGSGYSIAAFAGYWQCRNHNGSLICIGWTRTAQCAYYMRFTTRSAATTLPNVPDPVRGFGNPEVRARPILGAGREGVESVLKALDSGPCVSLGGLMVGMALIFNIQLTQQ